MGFNIIKASKTISDKYVRYLKTMFDINDPEYKEIFNRRLAENNSFAKGPYLDVTSSFEKGRSLEELIQANIISPEFRKLKRLYDIPNLHYHQEEALLKTIDGQNLIVSTGTGSGKTECFLLPLINELMREKETGTLSDGVRALIIYPMNALANDQIDRLRKTFIEYPDITFGCYTGQTRNHEKTNSKEKGAIDQYIELNGQRMDDVRLRKPLPNERLSRDSMKSRPPHILITNYAMLEYLMLRPEDNVFFDGEYAKNWKFVILDEAHTYTGSTGIEVSMLLKRLMAKLDNKSLQYILTSATLGNEDSNDEVISFAEKLCSAQFKKENIIRAKRVDIRQVSTKYDLKMSFYQYVESLIDEGYDDAYIISETEKKYGFEINESTLSEYLYELLLNDNTFWKIKNYLSKPRSVEEIKDNTGFNDDELSSFVEVASRSSKNGCKLFDSRYHMFLRATDGVFITLAPHKDLFLTRKKMEYFEGKEYSVFEAVTCSQCHSLYLIGNIQDGYLKQKSNADGDEIKSAFYIGDTFNDSDEDSSLESSEQLIGKYELCPHCGFVRNADDVHKHEHTCGHDENEFVTLYEVRTTDEKNGRVTKCISCENVNRLGILRGFFTGQESSTAVIGTSLFEELPSHEKKIVIHQSSDDGFDFGETESVEEVSKAKQFIAFSDNRQAAAYFTSYLSTSYNGLLYGRLIMNQMEKLKENEIEVPTFVNQLTARMQDNKIIPFDDYLFNLKTGSLSSYDYEKIAWQAILKEFVDSSKRNSLFGLGLLAIDFNKNIKFAKHTKYDLSEEEVKNICLVFVMGMLTDPAFYYPKDMTIADKEFFTHGGVEFSYLPHDGNQYVHSFVPKSESLSNKRLDYLTKILQKNNPSIAKDDVIKLLEKIWDVFFAFKDGKPNIMFKTNKAHYKVNTNNLVLKKNFKVYKCSKCGKLTSINVKGACPSYHCDGELSEVDVDEMEKDNHYYRLYHDLEIKPLRVVEHTAQLNKEEAYNYQNLFKEQKIDVLSCSTTFEMGVDVGDLETVFMRNMPPSPSNYAQRAGRAGRSAKSAALAVTFCNKSNHDFHFFDRPTDMISGVINPPHFKTDNEKICIRHLYSSALSFFFKRYPMYFSKAKDLMEKNKETGLCGFDVLKVFLTKDSKERKELKDYLLESVPNSLLEKFEIENYGWTKWLLEPSIGEYPSLFDVRERYLDEIEILRKDYEQAKSQGNPVQYSLIKRINTYQDDSIISFLSRNNILPKYGFPVDTVELEINTNTKENNLSGLELSRNLGMALSEYAPGCEVVANNKLVKSRYIKKGAGLDWRKYDYVQCQRCQTLNVCIHQETKTEENHPLCQCKQCHGAIKPNAIKTFLIPEFGFVAEAAVKKPTLIKPERTYKTEATFYSYGNKEQIDSYKIGDTNVNVSMVSNDGEMVLLNRSDFLVCPICGYAIETPDGLNPNIRKITDRKGHRDQKGYPCKNAELERYSLGYKFKTDIIKIQICVPLNAYDGDLHSQAYSILEALTLASSRVLNIDATEISGCLQKTYYDDNFSSNFAYILYDTTPGGAGHVKRLNDEDKIYELLQTAFEMTQYCSCDEESSCYSCLRTYENQKYHDKLKRKYVFDYLGGILNHGNDPDDNGEFQEKYNQLKEDVANYIKMYYVQEDSSKNFYETHLKECKSFSFCAILEANNSLLKDRLSHIDDTFQQALFHLIDEKGYNDVDVYKRAHIDRKLFSKIRSNEEYSPNKKTALSLCIALKLNVDETLDLLGRAGFTLSSSSKSDVIIKYLLEQEEYDMNMINRILFDYGEEPLYI